MARNIAPGYCIVEQSGSLDFQARQLFRDTRSPAANLFMRLNADTQWLNPGQILIISDPDAPAAMPILHKLRQAKQRTNLAFIGVNSEEAAFLQKHYGTIAALTSAGDQIFGAAGDLGEKYFSAIRQTLEKIEGSYQNQFRTQGTLIGQQFFIERHQLLEELKVLVNKPLLKTLARHSVKFRPYDDMRKALNLSSRSIVHEWSTAGISGIPGYSQFVGNAAKAAQFLKYGGYIGVGFSFAGLTNDIVNACITGREKECGRFAFKEYVKFGVGTSLSLWGGTMGSSVGIGVCAAIGIVTVGAGGVACAVVGSVAGGYAAGKFGEFSSEKIFQMADY